MIGALGKTPGPTARTIFVVDDDDAVRDSISALLQINGRDVELFASAHDFLDRYEGNAYCLLLDVEMPEMSGIELVKCLADNDRLPPTVLLTAHAEERATLAAQSLGIHAILPKPASENELLAAIDAAARAHKENPL